MPKVPHKDNTIWDWQPHRKALRATGGNAGAIAIDDTTLATPLPPGEQHHKPLKRLEPLPFWGSLHVTAENWV